MSLSKTINNIFTEYWSRKVITFGLLFFSLSILPNSYSMNLVEAYESALKNDSQYQVAYAEYKAGLQFVKIGRGGLLPQINATGSRQERDADSEGIFPITLDQDQDPATPETRALRTVESETDVTTERWSVSLVQPIFDSSKWFDYKRGHYQTEQSKHQLKADQHNLLLRVINAYFDVLRADDNAELAKKLEQADKNQLSNATKRAKTGANAQVDVYQSQAAYDASLANRLNEEDILGKTRDDLYLITGDFADPLWRLQPDFSALPFENDSLDAWMEKAQVNNPSIKAARASKEAARAAFKAARSGHVPTLYAELSYSDTDSQTSEIDNGQDFDYDSRDKDTAISINATIPLYSGGITSAQSRQLKYQYEAAEESYRGILLDVERQITTLYRSIDTQENRILANKKAVSSSKNALNAIQKGYSTGIHDVNDLLSAQRDYYSALRAFNNAKYDYLLKVMELKFAVGLINPSDLYLLNNYLVRY